MTDPGPSSHPVAVTKSEITEEPLQRHRDRGKLNRRVSATSAALGSLVGVASAVLTTFFVVRPNFAPSTMNEAQITKISVEPGVTLQQYFDHPPVKAQVARIRTRYPEETKRLLEIDAPRLGVVGVVVHYQVAFKGLRGVPVAARWSLFDADSGRRLIDSIGLDPLPLRLTIDKKDVDTGVWEQWVDTSSAKPVPLFVRLELYDERTGNGMTFQDSEKFLLR
jgi:hypothetical protein